MGCGCGRAGVAPVLVRDEDSIQESTKSLIPTVNIDVAAMERIMPAMAKFEPVPSGSENLHVSQNSNMLMALANLAGKDSSPSGLKLRGIPILSRKIQTANDKTREIAEQTSIPVAAAKAKKYSILDVIKDTLTGNANYSDSDKAEERLSVCRSCPNLLAGACTKCGCVVKLKVKYEESSCPVGKW